MVAKIWKVNTEFATTGFAEEICPQSLHRTKDLEGRVIYLCNWNMSKTKPVTMVTKSWKFDYKKYKSACI